MPSPNAVVTSATASSVRSPALLLHWFGTPSVASTIVLCLPVPAASVPTTDVIASTAGLYAWLALPPFVIAVSTPAALFSVQLVEYSRGHCSLVYTAAPNAAFAWSFVTTPVVESSSAFATALYLFVLPKPSPIEPLPSIKSMIAGVAGVVVRATAVQLLPPPSPLLSTVPSSSL